MSPWLWLVPVGTLIVGYRMSSGVRVSGPVAVVVLAVIVLLSRVIS